MADRCEAEMCPFWTGHGCACDVLDLDIVDRARARQEMYDDLVLDQQREEGRRV